MSGFEADWLTLREPADRKARADDLLHAAADHVASDEGPVIDLGCGTGSTFRALDPHLRRGTRWVFVDDDAALLDRAADALEERDRGRVVFRSIDLSGLTVDILAGARLVTASALFDLVSERFVSNFARMLREARTGLYSALTVDGRIEWGRPHEDDAAVAAAFSADQGRDKGFGPGLGGRAAEALEEALAREGFEIRSREADWHLGIDDLALQDAFHAGFAEPARAELGDERAGQWLQFRKNAARQGARLLVGHRDLLALP
ncbi:methyltransferase domain-containing protein [Fulvimarina endophytica]|uniref:Methyltransferase domain-containing protein n=1 Tax=Fulvimarina endophytica TaxID=2293836 RepID=A0A371X2R9_9HYPH|nr:methyltransferase [Fulvimarina endophytica]RFC63344.1 methyltransferase domain-containing protein [Fulvimarina endophytica]